MPRRVIDRRGRGRRFEMRRRIQLSPWLIAMAVPLLLLGAGGEPEPEAQDGMDVFFRDAELGSVASQELAEYPDTSTGESSRLERAFPDAPPQIPHTVEDMLPIFLGENECLDCHEPESAFGKEDVPIPASHFRRAVMGEGDAGGPMAWVVKRYEDVEEISGARYNCNMCHTPQAPNARISGNTFGRIAGEPAK